MSPINSVARVSVLHTDGRGFESLIGHCQVTDGERSLADKALGCDPRDRGFESRRPPFDGV